MEKVDVRLMYLPNTMKIAVRLIHSPNTVDALSECEEGCCEVDPLMELE
jgi:hypothetical protein